MTQYSHYQWLYMDRTGQEFGPFPSEKMSAWFHRGDFKKVGGDLLVRTPEWSRHVPMRDLYPHGNPFVGAPLLPGQRQSYGYYGYEHGYYGHPPPNRPPDYDRSGPPPPGPPGAYGSAPAYRPPEPGYRYPDHGAYRPPPPAPPGGAPPPPPPPHGPPVAGAVRERSRSPRRAEKGKGKGGGKGKKGKDDNHVPKVVPPRVQTGTGPVTPGLVMADGELPSAGSEKHATGGCKPCLFFKKGQCQKDKSCDYCHFPHPETKSKRIRPSRRTREQRRKQKEENAGAEGDAEEDLDENGEEDEGGSQDGSQQDDMCEEEDRDDNAEEAGEGPGEDAGDQDPDEHRGDDDEKAPEESNDATNDNADVEYGDGDNDDPVNEEQTFEFQLGEDIYQDDQDDVAEENGEDNDA
eukprot:TRINITY_DN93814_c0_g1_i1.p1 TRINITY_DN93814_c0_g1~~TRINITY_DN93814_c0_g1_i1.p1  ORF type:complete len:406 (-),score=61.85 TRINITY_DN93814_c0_g1_i1:55-1272(-)